MRGCIPKDGVTALHQDLDKAENLLDEAGWVDTDNDGIRDKEINGKKVTFEFTLMVVEQARSNRHLQLASREPGKHRRDLQRPAARSRRVSGTGLQEEFRSRVFRLVHRRRSLSRTRIFSAPARAAISAPIQIRKWTNFWRRPRKNSIASKRAEIYGQVHKIIYDDQPYLFLYNRHSFYGFNKKLRGYRFSPRGPFHYSPGHRFASGRRANPGVAASF